MADIIAPHRATGAIVHHVIVGGDHIVVAASVEIVEIVLLFQHRKLLLLEAEFHGFIDQRAICGAEHDVRGCPVVVPADRLIVGHRIRWIRIAAVRIAAMAVDQRASASLHVFENFTERNGNVPATKQCANGVDVGIFASNFGVGRCGFVTLCATPPCRTGFLLVLDGSVCMTNGAIEIRRLLLIKIAWIEHTLPFHKAKQKTYLVNHPYKASPKMTRVFLISLQKILTSKNVSFILK